MALDDSRWLSILSIALDCSQLLSVALDDSCSSSSQGTGDDESLKHELARSFPANLKSLRICNLDLQSDMTSLCVCASLRMPCHDHLPMRLPTHARATTTFP